MKGVVSLCPQLKVIVTSPLTRAMETADLLRKVVKNAALREDERLAPGGDCLSLVEELASSVGDADAAALVGHDPQLSSLVATLCTHDGGSGFVALDKGGAAALTRESEHWELAWLASREQLERTK
jgi:phosphohistidine phosphatase